MNASPEARPPSTLAPSQPGVLLVNLGTPDAPTPEAVRRYLGEFLWDPRVVEIPRLAWWIILNGIILRTRPAKSAEKYRSIWTPQGSPLRAHTEQQAALISGELAGRATVAWAMRYGTPSIAQGLEQLRAAGCHSVLLLPLYPQYADSTTASVADVAQPWAQRQGMPLDMVRDFHDDPGYIGALAERVRGYWAEQGRPERLLMSFHGLPRYTLERGDPYHDQCHATAGLLAKALELPADGWQLAFQSRFGRAKWLEPYTSETLTAWGRAGLRRVDVFCPGFVADCLETLEEIAMEGRETFQHAGGGEYRHIPCLNEHPAAIAALVHLIRSRLPA